LSTDAGSRSFPSGAGATILHERRDADGDTIRDPEGAGGVHPGGRGGAAAEGSSPFKNGAEALQAFRDLFDSDEEMDEFADLLERLREEERARYRD